MFRIDVFTVLPEFFSAPLSVSILGRALAAGVLEVQVHDPRAHAAGRHRQIDDTPYGGGPGMVMMPGPMFASVEASGIIGERPVYLLDPAGHRFDQSLARELAAGIGFGLICGRYEGVDERVRMHLVDGAISLGEFVLAGGEAAALAIVEAVGRLVPGVLGNTASLADESFGPSGRAEYPQYTRPRDFRGWMVPDVLLSGDHGAIARWRREQAHERSRAPGGLGP